MDLLVSDVPAGFVLGVAFVFGALWGSFFNVAIYRWPRDLSVVSPPSSCPSCGTRIAARYNVPIFGYLFLRGKTACCATPLSPRYPAIELLSAVLCLAVARHFVLGANPQQSLGSASLVALTYFVFVGGLVIATFVDLEHMIIPDEVSLPGAALGLATAMFRDPPGVEAAALGAGGGFLVIQVVFVWSYEAVLGRRGMGEGDSKLLMMIGAFLGWQGAMFAVFAGAAQGLIAFVISKLSGVDFGPALDHDAPDEQPEEDVPGREADLVAEASAEAAETRDTPPPAYWGHFRVPFGPFLALGALEYLFFGELITDRWLDLMQRFVPGM